MSELKLSAIVTGASSGIGLQIAHCLLNRGYEVYGIGRTFTQDTCNIEHFHTIECDLMDTKRLCNVIHEIKSNASIKILVNNAGIAYYGLHEELSPEKISRMVRTNLEVPMILTQQLMREIKNNEGYIINISSVTATKSNPHGCAYGATKAGLSNFSHSIFDEARKYGVSVVTIHPDMTKTALYRNADFCQAEEEDTYLLPEEVANAVDYVLSQRNGMVVTDITLQPQKHRIMKKHS